MKLFRVEGWMFSFDQNTVYMYQVNCCSDSGATISKSVWLHQKPNKPIYGNIVHNGKESQKVISRWSQIQELIDVEDDDIEEDHDTLIKGCVKKLEAINVQALT